MNLLSGLPRTTPARIGQRLVEAELVTQAQVDEALESQARKGGFLGQIIVDLGFITASEMGEFLSHEFGVPYVDLLKVRPDPEALALLPEHMLRAESVMPLRVVGDTLEVAMVDPLDVSAIDRLQIRAGKRIAPRVTMAWELAHATNQIFDAFLRTTEALEQLIQEEVEVSPTRRRARSDIQAASEAPIVRLVDAIIESALAQHASDIHFEPHANRLRVRLRIDGTLIEQASIPKSQQAAVLARLKVLATMDITESRRPQDGRMRRDHHNTSYDFRVSSVPTVFGEKLVLRVLDLSAVMLSLGKLGFPPAAESRLVHLIHQPHGMVVVVGPTGSGKSTTLYSALNLINNDSRNIMTLEDPVEYNIPGLNQSQVNPRIGLTFASGLRSFVRQDPDVILVGEIRDRETAEMAVQASLTGHLMLSTLHTNSAVGTIARLTNLGVDPFLVSQALIGVVSQRLLARVCVYCAEDYVPDPEELDALHIRSLEVDGAKFKLGAGCSACRGRGYLGRLGIYEVMLIDEELRRLIMRGASEAELQAAAVRSGMQTLRDCALEAVKAGLTTPKELGRVVVAATGDDNQHFRGGGQ